MDEIWCDLMDHILDHLGCGQTGGLAPTINMNNIANHSHHYYYH